jgi:hypothetical protein
LVPTDPPASTFKTLDEVEPRIPIRQSDIPVNITQSGSYYFAEDIESNGDIYPAIWINTSARNVTLDLGGFTLYGGVSPNETAISISSPLSDDQNTGVVVRNGHIRGFPRTGIASSRANVLVSDLNITSCGDGIVVLGTGSVVRNCTVSGIGGLEASPFGALSDSTVGIRTGNMGLVEDCIVRDGSLRNDATQSLHGIWVTPDSVVRNCQVINMVTSLATSGLVVGIRASTHSVVENCSVLNTGSTQFGATGEVRGIYANRSTVRDCIVRNVNNNSLFATGIESIDASHLVRNRVDGVRALGQASPAFRGAIGIHATRGGGIGSVHIEENTVLGVEKLSGGAAADPEGIRAQTNAAMIRNNVVQVGDITVGIRVDDVINPALIGNHVRRASGGVAAFRITACSNAYLGANIGTGIVDTSVGTVLGTVPAANAF